MMDQPVVFVEIGTTVFGVDPAELIDVGTEAGGGGKFNDGMSFFLGRGGGGGGEDVEEVSSPEVEMLRVWIEEVIEVTRVPFGRDRTDVIKLEAEVGCGDTHEDVARLVSSIGHLEGKNTLGSKGIHDPRKERLMDVETDPMERCVTKDEVKGFGTRRKEVVEIGVDEFGIAVVAPCTIEHRHRRIDAKYLRIRPPLAKQRHRSSGTASNIHDRLGLHLDLSQQIHHRPQSRL